MEQNADTGVPVAPMAKNKQKSGNLVATFFSHTIYSFYVLDLRLLCSLHSI
mgnify:CR=1 FL=1